MKRMILPLTALLLTGSLFFSGKALGAIPESPRASRLNLGSGFKVRLNPYGAFGGGSCRSDRVPVIFIHGNGDFAGNWMSESSNGGPSVIEEFHRAGYSDCDLFGVTYLSPQEREAPQSNYHSPDKAKILTSFIEDVLRYTGQEQVDIIAHSLGVTMSLHTVDEAGLWPRVRKFIGISGAMRGLYSCVWAGFANVFSPTCAAQNLISPEHFGFWPHGIAGAHNPWIGDGPLSLARIPTGKKTEFYTIRAGIQDEVVCEGAYGRDRCASSPEFFPARNVRSQLNVGDGAHAPIGLELNVNWWNYLSTGGDSGNGVGHLRAKTNTGPIQVRMLTSECSGLSCCGDYPGRCADE